MCAVLLNSFVKLYEARIGCMSPISRFFLGETSKIKSRWTLALKWTYVCTIHSRGAERWVKAGVDRGTAMFPTQNVKKTP